MMMWIYIPLGQKDIAMLAACVVGLRWPDRRLLLEYLVGHTLVGHLETSNMFRPIVQGRLSEAVLQQRFLRQEAP